MNNWISTIVLSGALALSGTALAQQSGTPQGSMNQPQAAQEVKTDFEEQELKTFVEIQKDIGEVRNEYAQKIQTVEDQEEAQALQEEARDELIGVVENADLSVEKYNQIAQAYQASPEVRKKVNEMVQQ